jgi:hypothetical protein
LNFTFDTNAGKLDLLGEVPGLAATTIALSIGRGSIFGSLYRVLSLEKLIAAKRAAGRPKDLLALVELEAILEHRRTSESSAPETDERTSNPTRETDA